jgi:hypothetical protein
MANVRGIFRLNQVYEEQLSGNWAEKTDVFRTQAASFRATHPFGYFLSGDATGPQGGNAIERVSYDNDTATCLYRAACPRSHKADAAGNETFMYFGGGEYTTATFVKYDYSNDTTSPVPGGSFSVPRNETTAVSNTNYTYFAGSFPARSTVDRIDNSNDTVTTVDPMTAAKGSAAGVGNKNYGYFHGGEPGTRSDAERIDYSSETFLSPKITSTGHARHAHTAFGNADKAYFTSNDGSSASTAIKGFDYSNDTASYATKGALFYTVDSYPGATGNSSRGYICGRRSEWNTNLNRYDYSNDTATATAAGNLVYRRNYPSAASPQEHGMTGLTLFPPAFRVDWQHGYAVGGSDRSVMLSNVDRVDYSNDLAVASVRGYLAAARGYGTSVSSRDFGYSAGGRGPAFPAITSDTQRISYASDTTTASPKGNLSEPWRGGQTSDNINYAYLLGGMGPGTNHTLTNRIDFSNDTAAAVPKGNMDVDRYSGSGCGNEDYGFVGAGLINSNANNSSSISRIDYSSDTTQLSPKGPLTSEKRTTLSSSNANFGYWAGYSPATRVDKYSFANDTTVAVADLPNPQFYSGATGNASFGYYMAGYRVAPSLMILHQCLLEVHSPLRNLDLKQ